ncbi:DedA family protein [Kiritimatiellota bacterium B12222]|nr:DedA family protein [Kiritimatiellota bacterium B12222]
MTLDQLITQYGYGAVGAGAFFESNPVLIMGGLSARRGYLELPWVIFAAFIGASLGNQLFFMIGHAKGQRLLKNRPIWKSKSEEVLTFLNHHELLLFLGYRFVPGFTILTPFLLGAAGFTPSKFFSLNLAGALLWASVITVLGSMFGKALELAMGNIHRYEPWIFGTLSLLAILFLANFLRKSRAKKGAQAKSTPPRPPSR